MTVNAQGKEKDLTQHETTIACAELQHWWELNGTENPRGAIRGIAMRITRGKDRKYLEEILYEHLAQLDDMNYIHG